MPGGPRLRYKQQSTTWSQHGTHLTANLQSMRQLRAGDTAGPPIPSPGGTPVVPILPPQPLTLEQVGDAPHLLAILELDEGGQVRQRAVHLHLVRCRQLGPPAWRAGPRARAAAKHAWAGAQGRAPARRWSAAVMHEAWGGAPGSSGAQRCPGQKPLASEPCSTQASLPAHKFRSTGMLPALTAQRPPCRSGASRWCT